MNDIRQQKAAARMALRLPDEVVLQEGQVNDDPNIRSEFPRMLYRATDKEERNIQTDAAAKCGETWLVTNRYDGHLCETKTVTSLDEMEEAIGDGWDVSPKAAHGIEDGAKAAVSAKDERIAELEAMLAEQNTTPEKRGPGRPPKAVDGGGEPVVDPAQA